MDYKDILGFSNPKKKVVKKTKSKKESLTENLINRFGRLNEWSETHSGPKRWSKDYNNDNKYDGLTEFEKKGGKDTLKEVGAAAQYHKLNKQIEKSYRKYWDDVKDLESLMVKKGLKIKAKEIHKEYSKKVLGFQAWLRKQIDRLL